jgi:dihydrolipoamide dehydrogenase
MTTQEKYDLIIIGAGPGGYVAAVRAAQLGMKVCCIEKEDRLGGVCLNVGCIPSKALLDSSEYYSLAKNKFSGHGINIGKLSIDLDVMMQRKQQVVESLTDSVRQLLEGNKIEVIHGQANLVSETDVEIKSADNASRTIAGTNILLATGSRPVEVKGLAFDGKQIVSSTEALAFESIPEHLVVVGGGYIGLELGSVWARLGAKVTVLEMMGNIAGATDGQVSRTLFRILKKQGLQIELNTKVLKAETVDGKVTVFIEKKGKSETLTCDKVLVAVGRHPLTDGLNLEAADIETDAAGRIVVDEAFRTTAKSIYAIGDLIAGPMLAHKASAEGRAAVENMAGHAGEVNYDAIPAIVYTWPEVASVGLTEEQLKERKIPYCVGTYPFTGAGRARCMGETDGFVKMLSHTKTDRILGVHIIGPRAADMIAEAVLAIETGASSEDIARVIHGHPTFSEALQESAMVAQECSIYVG